MRRLMSACLARNRIFGCKIGTPKGLGEQMATMAYILTMNTLHLGIACALDHTGCQKFLPCPSRGVNAHLSPLGS
jgi:hypothetical protein